MCDCKDKNNSQLKRWTIVPSNFNGKNNLEVVKSCSMPSTFSMKMEHTQDEKDNIERILSKPITFWNSIEELAEYQEKHGHNRE